MFSRAAITSPANSVQHSPPIGLFLAKRKLGLSTGEFSLGASRIDSRQVPFKNIEGALVRETGGPRGDLREKAS
jgi:hypothetical protein